MGLDMIFQLLTHIILSQSQVTVASNLNLYLYAGQLNLYVNIFCVNYNIQQPYSISSKSNFLMFFQVNNQMAQHTCNNYTVDRLRAYMYECMESWVFMSSFLNYKL
jgi:hypothetical protein